MTGECPAPEELARAVAEGAPASMTEHVAACDACGLEWESANELRALARALPFEAPAPERVLALRARVVERASAVRRRGLARGALYAALAAAAAAVLAIGLRHPVHAPIATEAAPRYHGAVVALNGARWSRQSAAPDEVVRLESGTIHVEVTPLGPGERFRIRAGDGEVEVRGTAFDVAVDAGHMTRVAVVHGRVEVRGAGAPEAVLGAGEKWVTEKAENAPEPAAAEPVDSASFPAPPPARASSRPVRPVAPSRPVSEAQQPPGPAERAQPSTELPEVANRAAASPPAQPSIPPLPSAPKSAPLAPPGPGTAQPTESEDRTHEEDRRERRDERRERHDQRRWR